MDIPEIKAAMQVIDDLLKDLQLLQIQNRRLKDQLSTKEALDRGKCTGKIIQFPPRGAGGSPQY